jgi:hypothetical protein
VPKPDIHVNSSPIASNEFNGIFVGILKLEKLQNSLWQGMQATVRFPPPTLHYLGSVPLKKSIESTLKRIHFLFGADIPDELVRTTVSLTYAEHVLLKTKKWNKK